MADAHEHRPTDAVEGRPDRASAGLIALGSILSVALMARHPTTESSGLGPALAEIAREASGAAWVHGGMIASVLALLVGYVGLARRLGLGRIGARAGLVAYGFGALALSGAALINGFVLQRLAADAAGGAAEQLERLRPVLALCHHANQALAQAGTLALSLALACWSGALLSRAARAPLLGLLGLALGLGGIVGLLSGHLRPDLHGMGAVVLGQALWGVAASLWLLGRPRAPSSA